MSKKSAALEAAMLEYGRYIQQGEGSTRAVERAIEIYNYVNDSALQPAVDKYMHAHKHLEIMPGQMQVVDCGDMPIHKAIPLAPLSDVVSVWKQEVENLRKQVKSLMDATAIQGNRITMASTYLQELIDGDSPMDSEISNVIRILEGL